MLSMIQREQIEELLKMPVDQRRRVLQLLQASLSGDQTETPSANGGQPLTCCKVVAFDGGTLFGWPREHGSSR